MTTILKVVRRTRLYTRDVNGAWLAAGVNESPETDVPESEALAWFRGTGLTASIKFAWPDGHVETHWGGAFLTKHSRLGQLKAQEDAAHEHKA